MIVILLSVVVCLSDLDCLVLFVSDLVFLLLSVSRFVLSDYLYLRA